jgi:hypothetical protein
MIRMHRIKIKENLGVHPVYPAHRCENLGFFLCERMIPRIKNTCKVLEFKRHRGTLQRPDTYTASVIGLFFEAQGLRASEERQTTGY